ncbi:MAG: DNA polymerase I [Deltaproteobacteria bacterium]|nr:DNA polymerase I [Deltaproteobacteria bacterium]MBW2417607.1 DNA polymerase I [Deltaproteobacteria bacterium]
MEASDEAGKRPRRLVVVDGANALFRAFFALPSMRAPDGLPTNAALGFVNMLRRVLREEKPDYIAVALDPPGGSFRRELYPEYKAQRDATPEDLKAQLPIVRELIDAHEIPLIEIAGFEADDVIATLVERAPEDVRVSIISTDKDLMQLCSERVELVDGIKDRRFGPAEVEEKFGVPPQQMLDLRALVGDPSDNIPGVKGIGLKGAGQLIREWGDLESLLEHAGEVKGKRAREGLQEHAEDARLSKRLSALECGVELGVEFEALRCRVPDAGRLRALYQRLGFTRLVEALDEEQGEGAPPVPPRAEVAAAPVEIIGGGNELRALVEALGGESELMILPVSEGGSAVEDRLVGVCFLLTGEDTQAASGRGGRAVYVPVAFAGAEQATLPLDEPVGAQSPAEWSGEAVRGEELAEALGRVFGPGAQKAWLACNAKQAQSIFGELGLSLPPPTFDLEIAAFLLDPAGAHGLAALGPQMLGRSVRSWEELAGRGAKARPASALPIPELAEWAGEQVRAMGQLLPLLRARLEADELLALFEQVELPLTAVLSRMERNGVRIDEDRLASLSRDYGVELERLEGEIYELAGERFLVSSPKQLQVILFEKLKLPPLKKTKTGYSTAEGVLEQLSAHHELPGRILAWRQLSKLKSTYLDALPKLVNEATGRIHPTFNQIGAATGRLSASDPNVQNIPIRSEEGVRIREAFVPEEGRVMLSADYSQVELRILAHYSGDESLVDAFGNGEDIHRRTAAEVAGIGVEEVSDEERARAKAVNFGIIYGSSAFGLANNLGIATAEAQEIVDAYFVRYRGVRRFLDETVVEATERGHVCTLLGRRRYLPDLRSKNRVLRQAAERMAVNTVIQGTAADLIKKAMVEVDAALMASALHVRMILQVHDELVFELPPGEVEVLTRLVRECMEGVFSLEVPLEVDVGVGRSWREAH